MKIKTLRTLLSDIRFRTAAIAIASGVIFNVAAQTTWQSSLVKFGADGKLVYTTDANKNVIPDFSYSGYRNNDRPVPLPTKIIATLTPQSGDNTNYINNAISAAASVAPDANGIRGVIVLAKGNYQINGTIYMNVSGVTLRGAGSTSDPNVSTIFLAMGNTPNQRTVVVAGGGGGGWNKTGTYQANIMDNFVKVGAREFSVATTSGLNVGDHIAIYSPCTQSWINAIGGGGTAGEANWAVGAQPLVFKRVVKAINGNRIMLDGPIYNHLDKALAQAYIYKVDRSGIKTEIGLENFRIDIRNWSNQDADEAHAWNAVGFVQAEDCWAKNVTTLHFGQAGFRFTTAARITVDNCKALEPVSIIDGERRYNFNFQNNCIDILVKNCEANKGRHAFVSNGTSSVSGIVVLRCKASDNYTSSEGHRRWTMGMLFDNFSTPGFVPGDGRVLGLYSRGNYGSSHGWSLAHSVAWNCDMMKGSVTVQQPPTAQNYVIGGYGKVNTSIPFPQYAKGYVEGFARTDGKTLSPQSLFDQQLSDRQTVQNQAPKVNLTSPVTTDFTEPASITLSAAATDEDGTVTKVEFYNGTTLLTTDVTSPYSFDWNNVAAGTYSLTAKATDNAGAATTSAAVNVTVKSLPPCLPVSASGDDGNVAANVLDNNLATRWSASGDGQWIQFCLETARTVNGIQIAFYNGNIRQSIFDIQVSSEGLNWNTVSSNVRSSGTSTALESFSFSSQSAKFIRIVGHGNSVNAWNSYTEVKIGVGAPVNKLPIVGMTSPSNNASVVAPANITLAANASDLDGAITKVEFFNGATKLGEDVAAPYVLELTGFAAGSYIFSAKATDDSGAVVTSSSVNLSVTTFVPNQLPAVQITSPSNNASYTAAATITINANASDADGSVSKVEFYNGLIKLGEDFVAPYSFTWMNVGAGTYSITAKATDNEGAASTSTIVSVKVNASTNLCSGVPQYVENGGYVAGSIVQNGGKRYQCKPYPYTGWCNGAAWAYGAGTGTNWSDAWTLLGTCTGARVADTNEEVVVDDALMSNAPNPFTGITNVKVVVTESGNVSVKIYDMTGLVVGTVTEGYLNAGTYSYEYDAAHLKSNVYLMKFVSESGTVVRKIMKTE